MSLYAVLRSDSFSTLSFALSYKIVLFVFAYSTPRFLNFGGMHEIAKIRIKPSKLDIPCRSSRPQKYSSKVKMSIFMI